MNELLWSPGLKQEISSGSDLHDVFAGHMVGGNADAERRPAASGGLPSRHRVRNQIERMILSGELAPNQRLRQMDLAKRFEVAQSVVREALLELQPSGLIRSVDNVGMFVSDMSPNQLVQAYQIRELLEGLAARLCCQEATPAEVREMYMIADRNYEFARAGRLEERSESDRDFHTRIILASRHQLLANLTESCRAFSMVVRTMRPLETVYAEHRAIVRAIEDKRAEKAERLAREHARAARLIIEDSIAKGTFKPSWVLPKASL